MKIYRYTTIALLVAFSFNLKAQNTIKETIAIPLSDPGSRVFIELGMVNGSIIVEEYDGKEVVIEASAEGEDDREEEVNGMKKISSVSFDISATEDNNEIEISTNSWQRRMDIKLFTPKKADLKLSTVHGQIMVSNIDGDLEIGCVNGEIELNNISGSVLSNTVNGDIRGNFKSVASNQAMSFVTLNGDVDISFPASIKAMAKLKSDRGDIFTDFDMEITRSQPKVESGKGKYKVSVESWVTGKINGGGPEYTFKNMNGNIYLRAE